MQVIYLAFDVFLGLQSCGSDREYSSAQNTDARRGEADLSQPATTDDHAPSIPAHGTGPWTAKEGCVNMRGLQRSAARAQLYNA